MNTHELIASLCKNKKVLDLGFVQHDVNMSQQKDWLHNIIISNAKSVLGIDYLEKEVNYFKKLGYNCKVANVENFDLNEKFDCIVAGELIEHLSNIEGFIESCKKHLAEDGKIIVTTPNVFAFGNIITIFQSLFGIKPEVNPEHTCWYDTITLQLIFERFGFIAKSIRTLSSPGSLRRRSLIKKFITKLLSKIFKYYPGSKIVGVFKLK